MTELDIEFSGLSPLCEVRLFTTGAAPADVQVWQPPCEQADVLLFPSHADDDVIFFGALAAQCVDRGLAVQVAYLVNHYDWQPRPQELLDALAREQLPALALPVDGDTAPDRAGTASR